MMMKNIMNTAQLFYWKINFHAVIKDLLPTVSLFISISIRVYVHDYSLAIILNVI